MIQAKDKILEEAAQSSLELKQAKSQLETKLSELKQESSSIRQQLNKAQRKLNEAGGYNRRSCNHEQKSKVETVLTLLLMAVGLRDPPLTLDSCCKIV